MIEVQMRPATIDDADLLLRWRNDKDSRANSHRQEVVGTEDHMVWMRKILANREDYTLLIAESSGKPVGAFRLDKFELEGGIMEAPELRRISYMVAPEERERGVGRAIVAQGCLYYGQTYGLVAQIREHNVASRRILESCDFRCLGELEKGILAYLRPSDKTYTVQ